MRADLAIKLEAAGERVRGLGSVLVAYSGGVDSSLALDVAHRVLGPGCLGVIARSPSLPVTELEAALAVARDRGIAVRVIDTDEVQVDGYRRNQPDRCYFCKSELYGRLVELAAELGFSAVLDGFNSDDRSDWRPGRKAAMELGVISPLDEVGMTKADVRAAARELGLPNWDKEEAACLSSRVPYGMPIDPALLGRIEEAEAVLRAEGFSQVRVRHGSETAVLEVAPEQVARLLETHLLARVSARLKLLGYAGVEVDPGGYRKGNLNVRAAIGAADGA
ncbi:MAG TPA: ATP-dependent sacrificial sulfur transferase LarE [Candidatus Dormibacteraeota bacterium]|nr:ATP-dependent sacrificial sulfur transferase LarE [Candidatus Dormibacteraeota bacterium]